MDDHGAPISRRGFLGAGGLLLAPAPATVWATGTARRDFTSPETFDALDRGYHNGNGRKDQLNERRGALAWDESYVLQAYVMMLEVYRDTRYADKLVDHIDHVLATRDSVRRVTAFPGRSMPVWRCTAPYNVGEVVLPGRDGRAVLRLRTAGGSAENINATVTQTGAGTFDVRVTREEGADVRPTDLGSALLQDRLQASVAASPTQSYTDLSLDPDLDSYAVQQINDSFSASGLRITAQAIPGTARDDLPRDGAYRFASLPYVHAVHTGMIVWPMARFARLVLRNRYLAKYRVKARGYLTAVRAALQSHDEELRHDPATGRSWYAAPKGSPFLIDGSDQPLNYTAAMARAWRELASATGDRARHDLAAALTRSFTMDVRPTPAGGLVWSYYRSDGYAYQGWGPDDAVSQHWPSFAPATFVEDVSHGHLEVDLVARARQLADLPDPSVLTGLARTFTAQVTGRAPDGQPLVHAGVDGTGTASKGQAGMIGGWLGVADRDPSIVVFVQDVFAGLDPAPSALALYGCAYLNWRVRTP